MQFHELSIRQVIIFRLYTVYNKHAMIKIGNQTRENPKYYRKCSNNFATDCIFEILVYLVRLALTYRTTFSFQRRRERVDKVSKKEII